MKRVNPLLKILCPAVVLLGLVIGGKAFSNEGLHSIQFPSDPITFQSGEGSQIATTYCLICHSAEYIYTQPPHSKEQWEEIVKKMRQTFGCPIPESDIPSLLTYLISQNEIQPKAAMRRERKGSTVSSAQSIHSLSGDSVKGKKVFESFCVNCHGQEGKGDGPIGQSLVPPAANLTLLGEKSDKEVLNTIRKGRPGTAMPSWKNGLSPEEILDLLAYIRTLSS